MGSRCCFARISLLFAKILSGIDNVRVKSSTGPRFLSPRLLALMDASLATVLKQCWVVPKLSWVSISDATQLPLCPGKKPSHQSRSEIITKGEKVGLHNTPPAAGACSVISIKCASILRLHPTFFPPTLSLRLSPLLERIVAIPSSVRSLTDVIP